MTTKEKKKKQKGLWLVTLQDKSKWVLDLDNMTFDNYNWYKSCGTIECEIGDLDDFFKNGSWKKLERGVK